MGEKYYFLKTNIKQKHHPYLNVCKDRIDLVTIVARVVMPAADPISNEASS